MILCHACNGRKQILGLGGITIDCQVCKGIGYIEKQIDELKVTLADIDIIDKRKDKKKFK